MTRKNFCYRRYCKCVDADAIQAISGYDGVQQGGVSYQISDSVSNLTGSSDSTQNGNINVTATGVASASDGAILTATANMDFDVVIQPLT